MYLDHIHPTSSIKLPTGSLNISLYQLYALPTPFKTSLIFIPFSFVESNVSS